MAKNIEDISLRRKELHRLILEEKIRHIKEVDNIHFINAIFALSMTGILCILGIYLLLGDTNEKIKKI